ncbi:MAG: imidazolonepropionase [Burkholderiales bacterium 70-64]|nr:MAG: imidazolonepropionase [Burkholderiales bacterium 70-64]
MRNAQMLVVHAAELIPCAGPVQGIRAAALDRLEAIADGALAIVDGRIAEVGTSASILSRYEAPEVIDATGCLVSPAFVDSHSHLLHGGTRHEEYDAKVTGRREVPLDGGIRYTVRKTREASDEALLARARADLDAMLVHGTATLEAKTGYGLEREQEMRLLRLTAGLRHTVQVVPTYLPLHVLPDGYGDRRAEYIAEAIAALPQAARLAVYCDVSCDPLCFTFEECLEVGEAARALGMRIRVHADQNGDGSGALLAARLRASAADHLDYANDAGLRAMAEAGTVATLLPGVTLHMCEMTPRVAGAALRPAEKPFMPLLARRAIDAGAVVSLSTDYNPGSCPTPSMQMVMQLAARLYRLSYAQIWNMCTLNAARALDLSHDRGSLEPGKRADVLLWSVPTHGLAINRFGVNQVDTVIVEGRVVVREGRLLSSSTVGVNR